MYDYFVYSSVADSFSCFVVKFVQIVYGVDDLNFWNNFLLILYLKYYNGIKVVYLTILRVSLGTCLEKIEGSREPSIRWSSITTLSRISTISMVLYNYPNLLFVKFYGVYCSAGYFWRSYYDIHLLPKRILYRLLFLANIFPKAHCWAKNKLFF